MALQISEVLSDSDNQHHVNLSEKDTDNQQYVNPAIIKKLCDLNDLFPHNPPVVVSNVCKKGFKFDPDEDMTEQDVPFYANLPNLVLPDQDQDLHDYD